PPALRPAGDEFSHWLVGRAVTMAASYRLLADRARRGPWPELGEFDCYACHHGLTGTKKEPHDARLRALMGNWPLLRPPVPVAELDSLKAAFEGPLAADAIPQQAEDLAKGMSQEAENFKSAPLNSSKVAELLADVKPRRWDEACQLYY